MGDALSNYELPVLKNAVSQRVTFAETAAEGKAVFEAADKRAAAEIEAIKNELMGLENE